jgi:hypothetical protein
MMEGPFVLLLSFYFEAHVATILDLGTRLGRWWARSCALSLSGGSA